MAMNQLCIWVPKFRNKYLLKLKIKTLLPGLKNKIENGNPLIALAESEKLL